jgi:hypothetical protein
MQTPISSLTVPHASSADAVAAPGAVPTPWVERLFERLRAILGPRMADLFAGAPAADVKREWAEALAGFTGDEIRRGIEETRTRKFPPNLPEFLHLCRPGLDPELAWYEAEAGLKSHAARERFPWSHPAIYWAARDMGPEIRSEPFAKHRKRWEMRLKAEFAKGEWSAPPDPTQRRLAAPKAEVIDPVGREEAKAVMRNLRQALYARDQLRRAGAMQQETPAAAGDEPMNQSPQEL